MNPLEVLVLKLLSINALPPRAVTLREIPTLYHEGFYDAVEERAFVVERFTGLSDASGASA